MRGKAFAIGKWVVAAAFIAFAIYGISSQWGEFRQRVTTIDMHWSYLSIASVIVLMVYALLIDAWRRMLATWGAGLTFLNAARIWFASSLGKFIPGYIWSLSAMGMLAKGSGASGIGAVGSSMVVHFLNLASGIAVVLLSASSLIPQLWIALLLFGAIVAGALILPKVLPKVLVLVSKITKREIPVPIISPSAIWVTLITTALAWVGYGIAFRFFTQAVLGISISAEQTLLYIGVYTGAYIIGILSSSVTPAGLGTREAGLIEALNVLQLMPRSDAFIVAFSCRLWLTVLEVVPGIIALVLSHSKFRPHRV